MLSGFGRRPRQVRGGFQMVLPELQRRLDGQELKLRKGEGKKAGAWRRRGFPKSGPFGPKPVTDS